MKCFHVVRHRLGTVLTLSAVLLPLSAHAAPCPADTLANVLAIGTCSIGDKSVQFVDYEKGLLILGTRSGNGVDASAITFTPLTGNPSSPGFRLSSPAFNVTRDSVQEDLIFTVTASSGKLISGFTVAMNNPSLSVGPSSQFEEAILLSSTPTLSTSSGLQEACDFVTGCATGADATPPAVVFPAQSSLAFDLNINQLVSGTASFDSVDVLFQQQSAVVYTYTPLNHPSAPGNTSAYGINNLGQIVGSYTPPLGSSVAAGPVTELVPSPSTHGFRFDSGAFTTIDDAAGPDTVARGINDLGTIVGYFGSLSFGVTSGFVDFNGQFTNVIVNSSSSTTLRGIDNLGLMVGSFEDTTTNPFTLNGFFSFSPNGPFNTLDYPGSLTSGLTGVNSLGAVTGTYANQVGPPIFGFVSIAGQFGTTGPGITINCINDLFVFAGSFSADGVDHGYVYANGAATLIDFPGATSTIVYGINNDGVLVGTYTDGAGSHGFIASPGL